jgi:spore coat protein U-like protein
MQRAMTRGRAAFALGVAMLVVATATRLEAACTVSATGVSFGTYDVFASAPTDSTGSITYDCAPSDKNLQITLSTGNSGTFAQRGLRNGADQLAYNLFRDAALTSVWGDGTGGSGVFFKQNPHPVKPIVLPVYGRIPAMQDVGTGSYVDSVIVTANF